jgi:nucleotide-binding universal stress UspA family protein
MTASVVQHRTPRRLTATSRSTAADPAREDWLEEPMNPESTAAPIIVGVDGSRSGMAATRAGASLAGELGAPLVLVSVRRGPSTTLGEPYYQRRLDSEMAAAERALSEAQALADAEGVSTSTEILEGSPAQRVRELARHRGARLIVLGPRRRRLGRSVSRGVVRSSDRPVMVAGAAPLPSPAG